MSSFRIACNLCNKQLPSCHLSVTTGSVCLNIILFLGFKKVNIFPVPFSLHRVPLQVTDLRRIFIIVWYLGWLYSLPIMILLCTFTCFDIYFECMFETLWLWKSCARLVYKTSVTLLLWSAVAANPLLGLFERIGSACVAPSCWNFDRCLGSCRNHRSATSTVVAIVSFHFPLGRGMFMAFFQATLISQCMAVWPLWAVAVLSETGSSLAVCSRTVSTGCSQRLVVAAYAFVEVEGLYPTW